MVFVLVSLNVHRGPWPQQRPAGVVHEPRGAAAAGGEAPGGAQRGAETGGAGPPELRGPKLVEPGKVGKNGGRDEDFCWWFFFEKDLN